MKGFLSRPRSRPKALKSFSFTTKMIWVASSILRFREFPQPPSSSLVHHTRMRVVNMYILWVSEGRGNHPLRRYVVLRRRQHGHYSDSRRAALTPPEARQVLGGKSFRVLGYESIIMCFERKNAGLARAAFVQTVPAGKLTP